MAMELASSAVVPEPSATASVPKALVSEPSATALVAEALASAPSATASVAEVLAFAPIAMASVPEASAFAPMARLLLLLAVASQPMAVEENWTAMAPTTSVSGTSLGSLGSSGMTRQSAPMAVAPGLRASAWAPMAVAPTPKSWFSGLVPAEACAPTAVVRVAVAMASSPAA